MPDKGSIHDELNRRERARATAPSACPADGPAAGRDAGAGPRPSEPHRTSAGTAGGTLGQRSEVRGQRAEGRGQRSEGRGQRSGAGRVPARLLRHLDRWSPVYAVALLGTGAALFIAGILIRLSGGLQP